MSIEIYPATVRQCLVTQNRKMQEIIDGINRLRRTIGAYTGENDLQGAAYLAHKSYMVHGHIAFLNRYAEALAAMIAANQRHIAAIDAHLSAHSWFHTGQIENEIATWTAQIRSIDFLISILPPGVSHSPLQNSRNNLVQLCNSRMQKLEQVQNYINATNGIYESAESKKAEANRLLVRLRLTERCATTGSVTMPTMLKVDIAILIDRLFPANMRDMFPGLSGMSGSELTAFLEALFLAGVPIFCMFGFDPVNLSTGNFIYSKEDITIPGRYPLEFKRFYNSICGTEGVLGANWTHNYNIRLYKGKKDNAETIHVMYGDGHMESYEHVGSNDYKSPSGSDNRLDKSFSGWRLSTSTRETYRFDDSGLLKEISEANHAATKFEYTDNLLTKAESPCGSLIFEYDDKKHIIKVSDHTGREVKLEYQENRLIKAKQPTGSEYIYEYDSKGKLSKITNPLGITAISNEYDKAGRMIRQSFADSGECLLSYDDKITTATEQNGNIIKYERDEKYRTIRTIYSDSDEQFEYNNQSKRTKHIDRNGTVRKFEYDKSGNLSKATDPLGHETTFEYSRHSKPTKIVTPAGGVISNEYDDYGNITEIVNPLGYAVKLTNDRMGVVTQIALPDGSKSNIGYDDRGNVLSVADNDGNETRYEYDALNRATATIDPNGNITKFEYNARGDITKVTNADGKTQEYEYNANGKMTKLTDFGGGVIKQEYNAVGKPSKLTDQSGNETTLEYDLMWNVTGVTDPCGNTVRYEYDQNKRIARTIDQEGNATNYEHDPNGNVTAVVDAIGARTEITYDALDVPIAITEPDGAVTKLEYDALGNVTKVIDPAGGEMHRVYDLAGQLTSATDQLGNITKYTYTSLGQIETIIDALNGVTRHSYYPGGKLKSVTRPGGEIESYVYDKNGNAIEITDASGGVTKVSYDSLDRINTITNALGHTKQFRYDALGNIVGITDENGSKTDYKYSPTGELIEVVDAMGHSTKYSYDKSGRMTKMEQYRVIDETYADLKQIEMQITAWERNKRGEVIRKSTPLGGESHYRYDALGNLISIIDEDKLETLYEYNLASKLTKVSYADGKSVQLGYNALRQLTELKDWLGTTSIELDPLGRALKVTDHAGKEVGYTWDALNRRESITYPDSSAVNYSYDVSGRIKSVISATGTTKYNYSVSDRLLERIMPNNIVTQQKTDPLGRLEHLIHKKDGEVLDSFKYSYDPVGNITQIEKHRNGVEADSGVFSYGYDNLGRLIEATNANGNKQYHYDNLGNRVMSVFDGIETRHSYNARNQLIKTTEPDVIKEYGYDARGNLKSILENGTLTSSFTFNAANRMVEAITPKGKAEYEYNGFLKRVSKLETMQDSTVADPLNEVRYTLDLTKPYNDLLAIGSQQFIWGNELLHSEGSSEFTYLTDHLGSPIRLMSETQAETIAYDEFGVPTVEASHDLHNPFGFTGYQPDNISGMQYAQARYYEPTLGRFEAEDTHWHPENMIQGDILFGLKNANALPSQESIIQSKNLYSYCIGNPVAGFDPTGNVVVLPAIKVGALAFLCLAAFGVIAVSDDSAMADIVNGVAGVVNRIAGGVQRTWELATGLFESGNPVVKPPPAIVSQPYSPIVGDLTLKGLKNEALSRVRTGKPERNNSGPYSVYLVWDGAGGMITAESVWYVGITKDFGRRREAHSNNHFKFGPLLQDEGGRFRMTQIATGLSRDEARAREQALMMAFGTLGGVDGAANIINSIASRNWNDPRFRHEIQRMTTLFSTIPCTD